MAERPVPGYDLEFDGDGKVGIIQEFEETTDGDTQDISGMGVVDGDKIRRKGVPVDVGQMLTVSGIIDEEASGYATFKAAMEGRSRDVDLLFIRNGAGWKYTGHSDSYSQSASRSNGVWNFSLTFFANEKSDVVVS